jgi:glycine dehydrogenase subunit 1
MSTVYMALQGKVGLKYLSELCYHKAHYAASKINALDGYEILNNNFFKEFTLKCGTDVKKINSYLHENKVIGGYNTSDESKNTMLLSFTEMNSKEEIDRLVTLLSKVN